jgi:hypothetical protein
MLLFESNLQPLRSYCLKPKQKQSLQLVVYQAIADTTDLPAKEVEKVIERLEQLLEERAEETPQPDPAY